MGLLVQVGPIEPTSGGYDCYCASGPVSTRCNAVQEEQGSRQQIVASILLGGIPLLAATGERANREFQVGAAGWSQTPSGYFEDSSGTSLDMGLDDDANAIVWAEVRHDLPVLPNLKVRYSGVDTSGRGKASADFSFGNNNSYQPGTMVDTTVVLNQIDAIFFYRPLDSLGIGLALKSLDGEYAAYGSSGDGFREPVQETVPMLYVDTGFTLPASKTRAQAKLSGISYQGSYFVDGSVSVSRRVSTSVSLLGGYRYQQINVDDADGIDGHTTVHGVFAGLAAGF